MNVLIAKDRPAGRFLAYRFAFKRTPRLKPRVFTDNKAELQLSDLPLLIQSRIVNKIELYAQQDDPLKFAKYISEFKSYRFRIGDYRAFFNINDSIICITKIVRRDKAYD